MLSNKQELLKHKGIFGISFGRLFSINYLVTYSLFNGVRRRAPTTLDLSKVAFFQDQGNGLSKMR